MKSAPAIAFDYRPSRLLAAAIAVTLVLALVAIALSGFEVLLKVLIAGAAVAYAAINLRRFWRDGAQRAAWHEAGHWRIVDHAGEQHSADLVRAVVRGSWIVLNLRRVDGARIALVLAPDNSDADLRRRLRVRLARATADEPNPL